MFILLFNQHREYFYDWCEIGSIYGAPADCLWGGGRVGYGENEADELLKMMQQYGISARLCFSNSLLLEEHLGDKRCNRLCSQLSDSQSVDNGVIVHSDLLAHYLLEKYPKLYLISSTTKVITDFTKLCQEINRAEFRYIVPDFRLNKQFDKLNTLTTAQKQKIEFLCNECCAFTCNQRKECYENVSRLALGDYCREIKCTSLETEEGYVFSKAMKNPGFIGVDDIKEIYIPMGFREFKIEGRSLGSAIILEFLLYYLTKPQYQLLVREAIYLDSSLDLF